ncbi:MAG: hypothetical protein ACFFBS_08075 [Promethearchaeota archaeon]
MSREVVKRFFGADKKKMGVFALLFLSSCVYDLFWFSIWYWIWGRNMFFTSPVLIHHGLPLSFLTIDGTGGALLPGEPLGFFPMNLVVDLVFWYLVSCAAVYVCERVRRKRMNGL